MPNVGEKMWNTPIHCIVGGSVVHTYQGIAGEDGFGKSLLEWNG